MHSIQEGLFWLRYCMDFFSFPIVLLLSYIALNLNTNEIKKVILTIVMKNVDMLWCFLWVSLFCIRPRQLFLQSSKAVISLFSDEPLRTESLERLWRVSELPVAVACAGSGRDRVLLLAWWDASQLGYTCQWPSAFGTKSSASCK